MMRSYEEKVTEIRKREEKLTRKRDAQAAVFFGFLSCAVMAVFVGVLVRVMPSLKNKIQANSPAYYAAVLSMNPIVGFVIIVVLAFALGICVTLFGMRIRKIRERQDRKP